MKECPRCGAHLDDQIETCTYCGRNLDGEAPSVTLQTPQAEAFRRPTGGTLIASGAALGFLGAILFLIAIAEDSAGSFALVLLAGASFQLGLFLGLAGAIIRALWFLPGDELKEAPRG